MQNKRRVKKDNQASLLSVENSHNSNPKKIVEVKDKSVKVRVTMDSGAAGHVMPDTNTEPTGVPAREQVSGAIATLLVPWSVINWQRLNEAWHRRTA